MALTTNADGTVTYSVTVPAAIAVTRDDAKGIYTAGPAVVQAPSAGLDDYPAVVERIAANIAIVDQVAADVAMAKAAANVRLAQALYAGDAPGAAWADLDAAGQAGYIARAESLAALGVTAGAAA